MFKQLKDLLPRSISRRGLSQTVTATHVCHTFRTLAKEKWGDTVLQKMQPKSYKDGNLFVQTRNSAWANELYNNRSKMLYKLNQKFSQQKIKRIIVKTGLFLVDNSPS